VLERFAELCSGMNLTPSAAGKMAREVLKAAGARRRQFLRDFIGVVRGLAREWMGRGYSVAVIIDLPSSESLRGTRLQRTLLRVGRLLENLARYEGLDYLQLCGVSGKKCPLCGSRGARVKNRRYKCGKCGLEWGRDWAACYRLARAYLRARKSGEVLRALDEWLQQHPSALR
ncbi:MAG: transposase, partial [Thermoproteales archaeon]|nr:transposase [Thermoproteales archaeon]